MPFIFLSGIGKPSYKGAAYSNLFTTPIVISNITSAVAGQIVVTWSGGLGNNVKYSYALSVPAGTATISTANTTSSSGTNTTTLTLSTTASISTTVTVTGTVLDGSGSATSASITTISPFGTVVSTASGTAGQMSIAWTGGSASGVSYTYTVYKGGVQLDASNYTVGGTAPSNVTFTFTDNASYSYSFAVTATVGNSTLTSATSAAVNSAIPITAFTTPTATSSTAGIVVLNWTGGAGSGVTYTYTVYKNASATPLATSNYSTSAASSTSVTFTFTDNASYSYTFTVTATSGASTLTSATSAAVTSAAPAYPYTTFTTIVKQTYTLSSGGLPAFTTPYTNGGPGVGSTAVNVAQTKMLFATADQTGGGLYYSTYSGGAWSALTQFATMTRSNGNNGITCALSADGTIGAAYGSQNTFISVSWTGATPVATTVSTSTSYNWGSITMTPDGSMVVMSYYQGGIYYSTWNTGTLKFSVPAQIGSLPCPHLAIAISPDKSLLMIHAQNPWYYGYITITWSGSTPTFSSTSSWNQILDNPQIDTWSMVLVGGNTTNPPTNLVTFNSNCSEMYVWSWNNTYKRLTYLYTATISGTVSVNVGALNVSGASGNDIYIQSWNGSTFTTKKLTLSVTNDSTTLTPYLSFSSITNQTYALASSGLPAFTTPYTNGGPGVGSTAVNVAQTKMLFATADQTGGGLYYSTYSGGSWSALSRFATMTRSNGNNGMVCALSADGTIGAAYGSQNTFISVSWTGATPVATTVSTSTPYNWGSISMTPDGSMVVMSYYQGGVYYSTWNTGTLQFSVPAQIGSLPCPHLGITISPDKSLLMIHAQNPWYYGYITITWSGSTPTFSNTSSWNQINESPQIDTWSIALMGGTSTTAPTTLVGLASNGTQIYVWSWKSNNNSKNLTYLYTVNITGTIGVNVGAFNVSGASGNVIYMQSWNGSTFTTNAVTLAVT